MGHFGLAVRFVQQLDDVQYAPPGPRRVGHSRFQLKHAPRIGREHQFGPFLNHAGQLRGQQYIGHLILHYIIKDGAATSNIGFF